MIDYSTIARKKCRECFGTGHPDEEKKTVCGCVYRQMFRECLTRYHTCRSRQVSDSTDVLEEIKHVLCSRPHEDYIVDFQRVCEKALLNLGNSPARLTTFHCLLDGITSHELISRRVGISLKDVPEFLITMTTFLGKVLHEVQPYALYPTKQYFGVPIKRNLFRSMPKKEPHPLIDIKNIDQFMDACLAQFGHSKASIKRTYGTTRSGRLSRSFMKRPGAEFDSNGTPVQAKGFGHGRISPKSTNETGFTSVLWQDNA